MTKPTTLQYRRALEVINQYEDDLKSNRFISNRQTKSYKKAREIEDDYIVRSTLGDAI